MPQTEIYDYTKSYAPLSDDGINYLEWHYNLKALLGSQGVKELVLNTKNRDISKDSEASEEISMKLNKALVIITQHLSINLRKQFMSEENPTTLWSSLASRFGDRTKIVLPRAISDFEMLSISDCASVTEYDIKLKDIVSRLRYCKEDDRITDKKLIMKTLMTMHPSRQNDKNNYTNSNYESYDKLIIQMLADEVSLKDSIERIQHQARLPQHNQGESNFNGVQKKFHRKNSNNRESFQGSSISKRKQFNQQKIHGHPRSSGQTSHTSYDSRNPPRTCFRCGTKGHVATNCKTADHLVKLYKSSIGQAETHNLTKENKNPIPSRENNSNFIDSMEGITFGTYGESHGVFSPEQVLKECNCLLDSGTTHTILKDREFFETLKMECISMNTIANSFQAEGHGTALITLGGGNVLRIPDAIYQPSARRNLLALKDLRNNGFHTATADPDEIHILTRAGDFTSSVDTYSGIGNGLYPITIFAHYREINGVEAIEKYSYELWHSRVGHPSDTTLRSMMGNMLDFPLTSKCFSVKKGLQVCKPCIQGKFKTSSFSHVEKQLVEPLARLSLDICGPIHPASGPFLYFQVLVDECTGYIHVSLLSTKNLAFARLLSKIIAFKAQYPDYHIKNIRCDNAGEYKSQKFHEYCEASGIKLEYSVPYTPQQNGRAEAANKSILLIVRPLLLQCTLPLSCWGHAVLHAVDLLNMRPTGRREHSSIQLLTGITPTAKHLRIFGCAVYVPIPQPKRSKLGPQRALGIYVGFDSKSIIRYLDTKTGTLYKARFLDCIFDEGHFPTLGGENQNDHERQNDLKKFLLSDDAKTTSTTGWQDQRTLLVESEVTRILTNQILAQQSPDSFNNAKSVLKDQYSYLSHGMNLPARVSLEATSDQTQPKKRGRPPIAETISQNISTSVKKPREQPPLKKRGRPKKVPLVVESPKSDDPSTVALGSEKNLREPSIDQNHEANVDSSSLKVLNSTETCTGDADSQTIKVSGIDGPESEELGCFSYHIAKAILDDSDPANLSEAKSSPDWDNWHKAMKKELASLASRSVFSEVQEIPRGKTTVGSRWVFATKRNDEGEAVRHKARLVAQGFSQKFGQDYDATYSPVMDATTFRFLTSFATHASLHMQMMDVVTAYLYGNLDKEIYMQVPDGLHFDRDAFNRPCVRLQRSLYGLKQSGRMWFKRLESYLVKKGFVSNEIAPCVFMKRIICIISVYVL